MRQLRAATASRVVVELSHKYRHAPDQLLSDTTWTTAADVAGGLSYSLEPLDQARILATGLYRVIEVAVEFDVPVHFLMFPRFATDAGYAHRALSRFVPGLIARQGFDGVFAILVDPRSIRIEGELEATGTMHDVAHGLPSLEQLDRIALRRRASELEIGT